MYKILIVDDEPKIREVIREYAEFSGYEVEEAEDGMSAIGLCKLNDYDIIIMDIMMPKLDGFSACKEIKKIKDIPTIMLSARGEEYDKLFGFELGIDDYIVKPFSPKELMARINAVLSRVSSQFLPFLISPMPFLLMHPLSHFLLHRNALLRDEIPLVTHL